MSRRKSDPLREMTPEEQQLLAQLSRSQTAPAVEATRAKLLLAVARGADYQTAILAAMPVPLATVAAQPGGARPEWERWQEGLSRKPTLLEELPPLRMLLVLENLAGYKTPEFVCWLFEYDVI